MVNARVDNSHVVGVQWETSRATTARRVAASQPPLVRAEASWDTESFSVDSILIECGMI